MANEHGNLRFNYAHSVFEVFLVGDRPKQVTGHLWGTVSDGMGVSVGPAHYSPDISEVRRHFGKTGVASDNVKYFGVRCKLSHSSICSDNCPPLTLFPLDTPAVRSTPGPEQM